MSGASCRCKRRSGIAPTETGRTANDQHESGHSKNASRRSGYSRSANRRLSATRLSWHCNHLSHQARARLRLFRSWFLMRRVALYVQEQTAIRTCAEGGAARKRDREAFEADNAL